MSSKSTPHSQFVLLKTRCFAPFFVTQLLGAFNDNLYTNALVAMLIMGVAAIGLFMQSLAVWLGALFVLGLRSMLVGPVKYAILQQHLREDEGVGDNALLGILPAGRMTDTGDFYPFRSGIQRMVGQTPVPAIPLGYAACGEASSSARTGRR